jgi:hypothetical protein
LIQGADAQAADLLAFGRLARSTPVEVSAELQNTQSFLGVRAATEISLFKSSGRRPPRHIHNPSELMYFTR